MAGSLMYKNTLVVLLGISESPISMYLELWGKDNV